MYSQPQLLGSAQKWGITIQKENWWWIRGFRGTPFSTKGIESGRKGGFTAWIWLEDLWHHLVLLLRQSIIDPSTKLLSHGHLPNLVSLSSSNLTCHPLWVPTPCTADKQQGQKLHREKQVPKVKSSSLGRKLPWIHGILKRNMFGDVESSGRLWQNTPPILVTMWKLYNAHSWWYSD